MTIETISRIRHCGVFAEGNAGGVITSTSTDQTESGGGAPGRAAVFLMRTAAGRP
jgi:hypothetical protein